jgi:hypothetical protein
MAEPIPMQVHRHFKGDDKKYLVLGVGTHVETKKREVIYVPLYGENAGQVLLRDYDQWVEDVKNRQLDNGIVYSGDRFWPLPPTPPCLG